MNKLLKAFRNPSILVYLLCISIPISVAYTRVTAKLVFLTALLYLVLQKAKFRKEDATILTFSIYQITQSSILGVLKQFLSISYELYPAMGYFIRFFQFSIEKAFHALIVSSLFLSITFLIQSFTGTSPQTTIHVILNLKFHFPPTRPENSLIGHPLTAGGVISTAFLISCYLYMREYKTIYLIPSLIFLAAIAVSYDRSYWISLLISTPIILFTDRRGRKLFIFITLTAAVLISFTPSIRERAISILNVNNNISNLYRLAMWKSGLEFLKEAPPEEKLIGISKVNFKEIVKPYIVKNYELLEKKTGIQLTKLFNHLHNNFLQIAVTYGLIGLSLFIALFGYLIAKNIQLRRYNNPLALLFISLYANWLIAGLFEYNFGDEAVKFLLYTLIGLNVKWWDSIQTENIA